MKIHKAIDDATADTVRQIAETKGLNDINYEVCHRLYKIGNKLPTGTIEMMEKKCVGAGEIRVIGSDSHVALYISSLREWFRTSPIISCKKKDSCVIVETNNSFYELVEDE